MANFKLPRKLPTDVGALEELLTEAEAAFDALREEADGHDLIPADLLESLEDVNAAAESLHQAILDVRQGESNAAKLAELAAIRGHRSKAVEDAKAEAKAVEDAAAKAAEAEKAAEEAKAVEAVKVEPEAVAEVVAEAEQITKDAPQLVEASFKGVQKASGRTIAEVAPAETIGWRMTPGVPKYVGGLVGYQELALSMDSMAPGSKVITNRGPVPDQEGKIAVSLASLSRDFGDEFIVNDYREFEEKSKNAIAAQNFRSATFDSDGAMAASAGWCSPSQRVYDFCDVTPATGLIQLADMNLVRGGLEFPEEPDFTELYATLPFRYTEAQLLANPTKPCVEIPCPGMDEVRAEAIGLCVTAGILQKRGWPEAVARFMAEVMKAHQVKVSLWSILDMVAGSTAVTIPAASTFGAAASFLNSLELQAVIIRQVEKIGAEAWVEGTAPRWLLAVARADLAYNEGSDAKNVTDAQVDGWLSSRKIRLQWVEHWQELSPAATSWPATVQVLLYPLGTWMRHLSNVIEVGSLYDKAQLQANRYTELFSEDEYRVFKRCRTSRVVTIPICANGAVGNRTELLCGVDA